jgi:hypothetical protein
MGILIKSSVLSGTSEYKTGFYNASSIGDFFELGYALYPTATGGSSWAMSTEPYNSGSELYAWGASVSIPEVNEAVDINRSGVNTAAMIAASLDGTAASIASIYTQNDYSGYVLPSYEGAQKMEIGLFSFDPTIFIPAYEDVSFWTSTEKDASKAYYFTIRGGGAPWEFGFAPKTDLKAVWPIIQYNYQAS